MDRHDTQDVSLDSHLTHQYFGTRWGTAGNL